ncbi:histidine phosphatase family protein [Blastopirellula marina]|uniref:Histidine phosphatase family protein n=1 Tax=Blastopirellula marina TaxID=124 RepID=A0A2S8FH64_9BACT|nr:histidine phosphatase family protein [Blastopirellula marina]PQO31493.1 histidine phosphatase family protein [Blastopirellula marina]PTL42798.1 histidine phosphatase family protein [Blastopirellula marina]
MLRIVLVRPGQTEYDHQGRIRSRLAVPLTEEGTRQASEMVQQLRELDFKAIYCAPCQACAETAEAFAAALGMKVRQMDSLANLNAGLWQGKLITEVKQNQPTVYRLWQENPEAVCPPQGETLGEVRLRAQNALDKIWKKHQKGDGNVIVVAPEPLASIIRSEILQTEFGNLWEAERRCGWWELIQYEKNAVVSKV